MIREKFIAAGKGEIFNGKLRRKPSDLSKGKKCPTCGQYVHEGELDKTGDDRKTIEEIFWLEPQLERMIDGWKKVCEEVKSPGARDYIWYRSFKMVLNRLVGFHADHPSLRNSVDYDTVSEVCRKIEEE